MYWQKVIVLESIYLEGNKVECDSPKVILRNEYTLTKGGDCLGFIEWNIELYNVLDSDYFIGHIKERTELEFLGIDENDKNYLGKVYVDSVEREPGQNQVELLGNGELKVLEIA